MMRKLEEFDIKVYLNLTPWTNSAILPDYARIYYCLDIEIYKLRA